MNVANTVILARLVDAAKKLQEKGVDRIQYITTETQAEVVCGIHSLKDLLQVIPRGHEVTVQETFNLEVVWVEAAWEGWVLRTATRHPSVVALLGAEEHFGKVPTTLPEWLWDAPELTQEEL